MLAAAGAVSLSAALAACGGDGRAAVPPPAAAVSQADIDKAMTTPTELTFWTWVPDIAQEVALFEKKYPAVKVKVVNAGQGAPEYTKLRTALQAGTGAPDVAQIEYQYIPTFTITDSLLDLRPYGAAALKDTFVDWTWGAGQRRRRRGLGDPAGHRPDGHALPQGHLRPARHPGPDDLGRVRRRGPQAPRRRPERLPDQPRRRTSPPPGTACCGRRAPSRT